jgi:hypothetical protein
MAADLCRRAIVRAAEILGGREKLAEYLKTNMQQLRLWSQSETPPEQVLQSLASVLRHEITKNHRVRRAPRPRRRVMASK